MNWKSCWSKIKELIQDEYVKHDYLLDSPLLKPTEKNYFKKIIDLKGDEGNFENSLGKLLIFLNRYYGQRVVILIDEYDAPIHAGFNHGYYDEIISFTRKVVMAGMI
jgi:hypothetical protein